MSGETQSDQILYVLTYGKFDTEIKGVYLGPPDQVKNAETALFQITHNYRINCLRAYTSLQEIHAAAISDLQKADYIEKDVDEMAANLLLQLGFTKV